MGSAHLLLLLSPPLSYCHYQGINPTKPYPNPKFPSKFRCSSSSRPNWNPNSDTFRKGRYGFDDDLGLGFGGREKRRNWWSDDDDDDDEEEDDDDDEDDDMEFGFWEETSAIDWVFKIFTAFGWMVPALIISTLVGTGSNSLIMALVIPLGQTALSLVMDKLWGGPSSRPNPKPKPKPKPRPRPKRDPFVGPANRARAANSGSPKMGGKSGSKFGGWDELDEQVGNDDNFFGEGQNRKTDGVPRQQSTTVKLRRRNREKPLFLRLVIAVFPFLGSWTRFFF